MTYQLPEPARRAADWSSGFATKSVDTDPDKVIKITMIPYYSAEQMREAHAQGVREGREAMRAECVKVCDELAELCEKT